MDLYISKYATGYLIKYASISFLFSLAALLLYLSFAKTTKVTFRFRNLLKKRLLITAYGINETRIFGIIFRLNQISFYTLILSLLYFAIRLILAVES